MSSFRNLCAQTWHYLRALGPSDAVRFTLADIAKRPPSPLFVSLPSPFGRIPFILRTNTSDFKVAQQIFEADEYGIVNISTPKIIFDIGANIGASPVYFARKYPDAIIYAFEPEANNFELLRKNAAPYLNIIPIRAGVTAQSQRKEVINRKTGQWGFTLLDNVENAASTGQWVDCTSIGDFMRQHNIDKIDLLKMDIEGGEREIFLHADEWIANVRHIVAELHDRIIPGCTDAFEEAIVDFPHRHRYGEKIFVAR